MDIVTRSLWVWGAGGVFVALQRSFAPRVRLKGKYPKSLLGRMNKIKTPKET